jgi:pyruvate dehydrogenase E2 component (dihydrolipoamide acetyltransferase)
MVELSDSLSTDSSAAGSEEREPSLITSVVMPQMGLEVTEGTVVAVHVTVGQSVAADELLLELETDKALTEIIAPCAGTVSEIAVAVGETVELGAPLVLIADLGEAPRAGSAAVAVEPAGASASPAGEAPERPNGSKPASGPARNGHGRLRVAPVARRAAAARGVDLESLSGTGPRGRITLADVERAAASRTSSAPAAAPAAAVDPAAGAVPGQAELVPLTGMRRAIARRMTASQAIPQFSLQREIEATALLAAKDALPAAPGPVRPGVTDLLLQALGELVLRHPALATTYVETGDGPALGRRDGADIGLAVATDRGLTVPVLRATHTQTLRELAAERTRLTGAARSGRLGAADMSGACVTLSNLGGYGIDRFTAMLNPGEAAILAIGRVIDRVVPKHRGTAVIPVLSLTLTVDHRVADGASGAQALVEFAELLEGAMTWRP